MASTSSSSKDKERKRDEEDRMVRKAVKEFLQHYALVDFEKEFRSKRRFMPKSMVVFDRSDYDISIEPERYTYKIDPGSPFAHVTFSVAKGEPYGTVTFHKKGKGKEVFKKVFINSSDGQFIRLN